MICVSVQVIFCSVWDKKRTFGHVDRIPLMKGMNAEESIKYNWPELISFKILKIEEREGLQ